MKAGKVIHWVAFLVAAAVVILLGVLAFSISADGFVWFGSQLGEALIAMLAMFSGGALCLLCVWAVGYIVANGYPWQSKKDRK
jgi:hypothetical protein